MISLKPLYAAFLAVAVVIVVSLLLVAIIAGWVSRRRGGRARAIAAVVTLVVLLVGLPKLVTVTGPLASPMSPLPPVLNAEAPVPAGSGLFLAHDHGSVSGGSVIDLVRASARTGAVEWRRTSPLLADGATLTSSDGILYGADLPEAWALQGSDGTELWHTTLVIPWQQIGATPPYLGVYQPVIGDGQVYLTLVNNDTRRGTLIALRARDGKQLWSRLLEDYYTTVWTEPLAAGDGLVIVPSIGAGVAAFHARDGSLAWQPKYKGDYVKLLGGVVYVSANPIVALNERTGALLWTLPCSQADGIAFSGFGTQLYVTGVPVEPVGPAAVYAFDTQQRRVLWTYAPARIPPLAAPDRVFIVTGTHLDAVRARDGTRAWRQEAEEPNAGPTGLVLLDNTLYVRVQLVYNHIIIFGCGDPCPQTNSLSAMRASDGALYWRQYVSPDTFLLAAY